METHKRSLLVCSLLYTHLVVLVVAGGRNQRAGKVSDVSNAAATEKHRTLSQLCLYVCPEPVLAKDRFA